MKNCLSSLKWKHGKFWHHGSIVCLDLVCILAGKDIFASAFAVKGVVVVRRGEERLGRGSRSVPHACGGTETELCFRLGEGARRQGQLRQTLLGQPRTQLHVQPSPTDSRVWGLRRAIPVCLRILPEHRAPSARRCACQVAISLGKIAVQFLGLRRQAILDLHSLEC